MCPLLCQVLLVIFFFKGQDMIPVDACLQFCWRKKISNIYMLRVTFHKSKSDPITALHKITAYFNASQVKSRLQQSIRSLCSLVYTFLPPVLSIATLSPTMLCSSHTELKGPQMCRACYRLYALPLQNDSAPSCLSPCLG